jgi:hypothetical protein
MKIAIQPFEPRYRDAVIAFNARMRDAQAPTDFVLPQDPKPIVRVGAVATIHYVAVSQDEQVRGGMICREYPALVAGRPERVVNISSPLSEGIVNPAFAFVGPSLIKFAVARHPHVFVVGMGRADNPLPRMLKAIGWSAAAVPFYFRLLRAGRCVRNLYPLRTSLARRVAARVASGTGVAALGSLVAHRPSTCAVRTAARFETEPVASWDHAADAVWESFASELSFGVERARSVLPFLYPLRGDGPRAWLLKQNGIVSGWFGMLMTRMSGNKYFGDLAVATLTDCVGSESAIQAAMVLATHEATALGADILVTNQQHIHAREACLSAGWRPGPSNFLIATSRSLSPAGQGDRSYVTRTDGDGLANLAEERLPLSA